ncbi:Extracellular ligand-binding receptor domain and GPCR, family 3, C-terminal domain and Periplasmic binding protein-like I domain-containing protein [Strongyloides ratti]|uniref:Extracellular ligand-binding receptor domain and GPCR, family 3, C-terminal domain and Periplasmic binding protein-like I domain-containing protein n=1 Tax=Strongyloides ratti TaxID=34506 RepID=A0A090KV65_STRRB|nr:Extracellular ligand-binding receptor domain and GPCR, family 3, C-terminal domain and Periplasmic binding protein-like I domain-containing protein [Strongyloides ratti]CEF59730.1 Extracellular ligand-binding receptor domain and GPCR, family 3, C-terminal domain and Periplasmic binding protein-like I domain-containing protein [Strongyloides ratti]
MKILKTFIIFLFTFTIVYSEITNNDNLKDLCSVFDPFRISPEENKYQIGGAFPLHKDDCLTLRSDTVQDIVAIQWALSHWNQNNLNSDCKIGFYAGDSCSRNKETISQTLRFLDSIGYHEPKECEDTNNNGTQKFVFLISPKDANASIALGNILKTTNLPVGVYSTASLNSLINNNIKNIISTAPPVSAFIEMFAKIMSSLNSNLVTIVDNNDIETVDKVINQLKKYKIYVAEVVAYNDPLLKKVLKETDSKIILSILPKSELITSINDEEIVLLNKLWIAIPLDSEKINANDFYLYDNSSNLQIMILQKKINKYDNFKSYFLKVVKNNYESYALLVSYLQQIHKCVLDDKNIINKKKLTKNFSPKCSSLTIENMEDAYEQTETLENIILLTYGVSALAKSIENNDSLKLQCAKSSIDCLNIIFKELTNLKYNFGANDPIELNDLSISFYLSPYENNVMLLSDQIIDGYLVRPDFLLSQNTVNFDKICEYQMGEISKWMIYKMFNKISKDIKSTCPLYRSYCGKCQHTVQVIEDRYFLSIPKNYPIYIVGMFDFHYGENCKNLKTTTDISLPMAFVHTAWTFRQRYPQLKLLKHIDFGTMIADGCSSGKEAINFVVQSESTCYSFEQANRNITIVPGSTFGYISGVSGENQIALQHYFSDSSNDAPMVSIDGEHNSINKIFTTMPSNKNLGLVLLRFLRKMKWEFVSVILSENDYESLSAFKQFERMANDRGICIAEVINVNTNGGENVYVHGSNVTLMFTTSKDASEYLTGRLKRGFGSNGGNSRHGINNIVHVMIGDAHNFYLHDPTNVQNFIGTVSIQPKDVLYPDFKQWLEMITPLTLPESWYWTIVEEKWQCALLKKNKDLYGGKMCTGEELLDVSQLGRMTKTGYLARGMERLLFTMDAVYNQLCNDKNGICEEFLIKGRKQILQILLNTPIEDHFEIYEFLPKEDVKNGGYEFKKIGNWSIESGLRLQIFYKTYVNNEYQSTFHHISQCLPPLCKCFLDSTNFLLEPLNHITIEDGFQNLNEKQTFHSMISSNSYMHQEPTIASSKVGKYTSFFDHLTNGIWSHNPINYIILLINTVFLFLAIAILGLVIFKMYIRVVKGNQSLGITLLIGIIGLYITGYFFIFDATDIICRCRMISHGLSYTLCFGVMIAKATQLKNAETLGFSNVIHISYWNYWQLLFFIVGVQLALSLRWINEPFASTLLIDATSIDIDSGIMVCTYGHSEFILSHSYVIILLILTLFINSQNRNIKRNYKETKWLFAASIVCFIVWIGWITTYFIVPDIYKNYVIVFEIIFCGTVLLAFMFGPKIYILLSYEPVIVECQPNETIVNTKNDDNDLYEKNCEFDVRSGSPTLSSETGSCRSINFETKMTNLTKSSNSPASGIISDEDFDKQIFHTQMRKKKFETNNIKKI